MVVAARIVSQLLCVVPFHLLLLATLAGWLGATATGGLRIARPRLGDVLAKSEAMSLRVEAEPSSLRPGELVCMTFGVKNECHALPVNVDLEIPPTFAAGTHVMRLLRFMPGTEPQDVAHSVVVDVVPIRDRTTHRPFLDANEARGGDRYKQGRRRTRERWTKQKSKMTICLAALTAEMGGHQFGSYVNQGRYLAGTERQFRFIYIRGPAREEPKTLLTGLVSAAGMVMERLNISEALFEDLEALATHVEALDHRQLPESLRGLVTQFERCDVVSVPLAAGSTHRAVLLAARLGAAVVVLEAPNIVAGNFVTQGNVRGDVGSGGGTIYVRTESHYHTASPEGYKWAVDAVVVPSRFVARAMHPRLRVLPDGTDTRSSILPELPLHVIPPVIVPSTRTTQSQTCSEYLPDEMSQDAVRVGYIGRLAPERSPGLMAHVAHAALPLLPHGRKRLRFLLFGRESTPGMAQGLESVAAHLDVGAPVVRLAGPLPHRCVGPILAELDIYVNLAVNGETFGVAVVEAMAAGLPIIVCNKGALPELIQHEVNGLVVDCDAERSMDGFRPNFVASVIAAAVVRLASNPILAQDLGARARVAAGRFTADKFRRSYASLYTELWLAATKGRARTAETHRGTATGHDDVERLFLDPSQDGQVHQTQTHVDHIRRPGIEPAIGIAGLAQDEHSIVIDVDGVTKRLAWQSGESLESVAATFAAHYHLEDAAIPLIVSRLEAYMYS